MELGSRAVEVSQEHERRRRARGIDAARQTLSREGEQFCRDCGEEIPEQRRAALPSATRCIVCQSEFEGTTA